MHKVHIINLKWQGLTLQRGAHQRSKIYDEISNHRQTTKKPLLFGNFNEINSPPKKAVHSQAS